MFGGTIVNASPWHVSCTLSCIFLQYFFCNIFVKRRLSLGLAQHHIFLHFPRKINDGVDKVVVLMLLYKLHLALSNIGFQFASVNRQWLVGLTDEAL